MLQPWNLQSPLPSGLTEKHCPRCGRDVDLPLGALCRICRGEIDARARRFGLLAGVVVTIPVATTVFSDLPEDQTARTVAMVGVLVCFVLVNVIVRRVVRGMQ
jgi:hypothetical protein